MTAPTLSTPIKPACPRCRVALIEEGGELRCPIRGERYGRQDGVPALLLSREADAVTGRQQALYDHVAHDYDEVFKPHVAEHYLRKRTAVVRSLLPFGGIGGAAFRVRGFGRSSNPMLCNKCTVELEKNGQCPRALARGFQRAGQIVHQRAAGVGGGCRGFSGPFEPLYCAAESLLLEQLG